MTDDDIIRIGGVELEIAEVDLADDGKWYSFRPKREQTGWICRNCDNIGPCVSLRSQIVIIKRRCMCSTGEHADWQPFYGKVVE